MKRLFFLWVVLMFVSSCDDGNFKVSNFNFDTATIQNCNGVLYKINKNEILFLDIPASTFSNVPTTEPIVLNVNSTNRLIYRQYNTSLTSSTFCTTIPPASLSVIEEWSVKEGVEKSTGLIQIITTEIKDPTTEAVTGYNHEIRLLNVVFSNANSQFVFENYLFGNYKTGL